MSLQQKMGSCINPPPCCQHHAWLHVLPALKLGPILRSSGCICVWLPVFVNLADPGKCFIFFVSSPIRSRLFREASSGGGFLR